MTTIETCKYALITILISLSFPMLCLPEEEQSTFSTAVELLREKPTKDRLERILIIHFEAITHGTDTSFLANGTYERDNLTLELSIAGRRPGMLRASFEKNPIKHLALWKDGEVWTSFERKDTDKSNNLDAHMLQLEVNYYSLYWGYENQGSLGLTLLGQEVKVGGYLCYLVENTNFEGMKLIHYIDTIEGLERRRVAQVQNGKSIDEYELTYHAFAKYGDDQFGWPSGYTLKKNEKPSVKVTYNEVRLNRGIGKWLFEPPEKY